MDYNLSYCEYLVATSTLTGLPLSQRHWALSNESDYWFGHIVMGGVEAIPVLGIVVAIIERIVSFIFNECFTTAPPPIESPHCHTHLPYILSSSPEAQNPPQLGYNELRVHLNKMDRDGDDGDTPFTPGHKFNLTLTNKDLVSHTSVVQIIGKGGSKYACLLEDGSALMLPSLGYANLDGARENKIQTTWAQFIAEEVKMGEILTQIGLLNPSPQAVFIQLEGSNQKIPAYLCRSFISFMQEDIYVIDRKNPRTSTWKSHLLPQGEHLNVETWMIALNSLCRDIARLCRYNIPTPSDSLNIAIVRNDEGIDQVRYFGFDFSSKWGACPIPNLQAFHNFDEGKATDILSELLEEIVCQELTNKNIPAEQRRDLIEKLRTRCLDTVRAQMNSK